MTFSDEQVATIRARRAAGESYAGIALDYGCHKNTIRRVAKDVPHGQIHYCIPGGFRAFGRDRRAAILAMLRQGPLTTGQIRDRLGGNPYHYLGDLHKKGIIESRTIWVVK